MRHDVVVIGGGSAGYAAASRLHAGGAEVAVVDPGPLGGLCILRGCMPTKAILRSAEIAALIRQAPEFGLQPGALQVDLGAILDRKDRLVHEFAAYRREQLRDGRFVLYEARARFVSPRQIQAAEQILTADSFIIATGSVPGHVPVPGLDAAGYITSDEALELRRLPPTLIVLGGGPVALELAQFYQRLGSQVTLIQRSHHVLSQGDEDIARPLEQRLREEGMQVYTGTQLREFSVADGLKGAGFHHEGTYRQVTGHQILQAMGRRSCIDGLALEAAGVEVEEGRIRVNSEMRTSQPHIYAVGDVNGVHETVHLAIQQGEVAAHNALHPGGPAHRLDERLTAEVVFTDPQVAGVGLCEMQCQDLDIPYLTASYPFADHGKALCLGVPHGHVKLLCQPRTGDLLGAHIVGAEAGELIHEMITVMHFHGTVHDLCRIPHYHPTLSEILTYPAEELQERLGR